MEILTALQWAKKGFIPNEGTEGTEQWTNCYYSSKTVKYMKIRKLQKPSSLPKGRNIGM